MGHVASRGDDKRLLQMIKARCAGDSSGIIADSYGMRPESVRVATFRVMKDDMEAHPNEDITGSYWSTHHGGATNKKKSGPKNRSRSNA